MRDQKLLSIDVFDTAITRLVIEPHHLHWAVGCRLNAAGILDMDQEVWRQARCEAEHRRRQRSLHVEITLAEIYEELAAALALTPQQAQTAMAIELMEERRLCRPIAAIRNLCLHMAAEQTQCFTSDTYLSREQVCDLLTACGYAPSVVHVSSEYRKTKARGDLFAAVGAFHKVSCEDIVHIGDNAVSDVVRARSHGCEATLFDASQPTPRERVLFAANAPGYISSAIAGAARAARLGHAGASPDGLRTASASVGGPLLMAYVLWVLLDVAKRGGRVVYFLARDGQILKRICDSLIAWLNVDMEARYLLASRQAFFLAALPPTVEEAVSAAVTRLPGETVTGLLTSLGFDSAELAPLISESGVPADQRVDSLSESGLTGLKASLLSTQRAAALGDRIAAAKAATLVYFAQEGLFAREVAYVVDLGWYGNLQLRMQEVIGDRTKLFGYYIRLFHTPAKLADRVRPWTRDAWPRPALLELFTLADHSSVRGFELDHAGRAVSAPRLRDAGDLIAWGVREQQAIIDMFVRNLLDAVDPSIFGASQLAAALEASGVAAFRHFTHSPTRAEGTVYGQIEFASDQNHVNARQVAPALGNLEAIRVLVDRRSRRRRTNWFHGSLARSADKPVPAALRVMSDLRLARVDIKSRQIMARVFRKLNGIGSKLNALGKAMTGSSNRAN